MGICIEKRNENISTNEEREIKGGIPDESLDIILPKSNIPINPIINIPVIQEINRYEPKISKAYSSRTKCVSDNFNNKHSQNSTLSTKIELIKSHDLLHIAIYGSKASGKTTFAYKVGKKELSTNYFPTPYTEITKVRVKMNDTIYSLIFTTPFANPKILKSHCYYVFFDLTNINSFSDAKSFIIKNLKNCIAPVFLIGNKKDLKKVVSNDSVKSFCKENNCFYFEISALNEIDIFNLLNFSIENILKY